MSVIESEVQRVMSLICAAPAASPGKRAAAQGVANDLLRQVDRLRGQDLGEFASAGLQLQGRCTASGSFRVGHGASTSGGGTIPGFEHLNLGPHEPIAEYVFGEPGQSQWFDEVGISEREACDADREAEHFTQVDEVGEQIQACCQAIAEVCTTGDIAMQELLSPVCTMLEMIARMGFPHLTDQAIDVAIDALKQASATAKDRNCVIEECLDTIATCVEKVAEQQPQEPVEYAGGRGGGGVGAGAAATVAANAPETPAPKPAPEPAPPTGPKEFHEPAPKPAPPAPAPEQPRLQECPRFETRGVETGTVSAAQAGTTAASADVLASAAAAASGAFEQAVSQAVQTPPVNMEVHFNFDLDGAINAGLEAVDCDTVAQFQPPAPEVNTAAWVGAMAQTGAAAVLEGLDCFAASLEAVAQCPGAECCTHGAVETVEVVEHPVPAPEPEPAPEPKPEPEPVPEPAPAPEPVPEPAPAPQPQDGVIPPPPELAEVEEPEPPAEKLAHQPNPATETAQAPPEATGTGEAEPTVSDHTSEESTNHDEQAAADSHDPWAMKKTGEW